MRDDTTVEAPEAIRKLAEVNHGLIDIARLGRTVLLAGIGVGEQDEEDGAAISALGSEIEKLAGTVISLADEAGSAVEKSVGKVVGGENG